MKNTFKGGIHPYEGKELTEDKAITEYLPKGDVVFPLSQHIGAPAKPVVKKGDEVLAGQLIAEAGGFVSANIHSSISGQVKAIEPRLTANGTKVNSIIITNDGQFNSIDIPEYNMEIKDMTREEIIQRIKDAGIVGMGGAGFPSHVKLSPKNSDEIDRIIVNASECEPYLTSDYRRMMEEGEIIVKGLSIVLSLFTDAMGIIAIEDNKPKAIKHMKSLVSDISNIEVKVLKTKYPEGAERQLIYATTGRLINSKMLPADAGCIVHNVDTIHAICEAVVNGKPLISRIVTVTGDAVNEPQNFRIRIGTSYKELVEAAGGFSNEPHKILSGGPMMGKAIYSLDIPTTKGSSAILCLTNDEVAQYEPSPCIRCGKCITVCPGRIMPNMLNDIAMRGDREEFVACGGMECCECGCCSFICPAKRHLTQTIAGTRKLVLASKKK